MKDRILCYGVLLTLLLALSPAASSYPAYTVVDPGTPPGDVIRLHLEAVNNAGQIVGNFLTSDRVSHAFHWQEWAFDEIPGYDATAINDAGQVVGSCTSGAFRWKKATGIQYLDPAGQFGWSEAFGINQAGDVVGAVASGKLSKAGDLFLWRPSTGMVDLNAADPIADPPGVISASIDDSELIVGTSQILSDCSQWAWQASTGFVDMGLPDDWDSSCSGMNSLGQAVGVVGMPDAAFYFHPFIWSLKYGGKTLDTLGDEGMANGINDLGQIVGSSAYTRNGKWRAVLWSASGAIVDLNSLIDRIPGWDLSSANCINDQGWIIADLVSSDGETDKAVILMPSLAPQCISISPHAGDVLTGTEQSIRGEYWDPNGYSDIVDSYLLVNTSCTGTNAAYMKYDAVKNELYLRNDTDTGWLGGYTPGSQNVIHNAHCTLDCANTRVSGSKGTQTITWGISFTSACAGKCGIWMTVIDNEGLRSSWQHMGAFDMVK